MPVSVLTAVLPEFEQLKELITAFPSNPLILEHFGGHQPGAEGWEHVLGLARHDNVYVKCTATPGLGGSPAPEDVGDAILELLGHYGARRLMWGGNFPDDEQYVEKWRRFDQFCEQRLSTEETEWLAGGTVASLYSFQGLVAPVISTSAKI